MELMLSIFILLCQRTKVTEQRVVTKGKFKLHHTGKGICRFVSIYAYCMYFICIFYGVKWGWGGMSVNSVVVSVYTSVGVNTS